MPQLAAWEKVLVNGEGYFDTVHGRIPCNACHGGVGDTEDFDLAHEGVVMDPDPVASCLACHEEETVSHVDSLHSTLAGYTKVLEMRAGGEMSSGLQEAFDLHCTSCHATCGQCHVNRPTTVGAGLLAGHDFKKIPPMNLTCTGCHGSRVNDEYKGKNEMAEGGHYPADVHFNPGGMACIDCHPGEQMHGMTGEQTHRYDGPPDPDCEDCHDVVGSNPQHSSLHLEKVTCQVCHTVDYKNCYSCHVQKSPEGVPYFKTDPSQMLFLIGKNPLKSPDRPWDFTVLRHVPVDRDSFSYYGDNLLPTYDNRETWTYATPHNIQLKTPQNASCNSCHGNDALFLTPDKVDPDELEANQNVIVDGAPPAMP